jgi:anti-sigma B factor antagonist
VQLTTTVEGSHATISGSGDWDIAHSAALREALGALVDDGIRTMVIDLSDVQFVDSTVLGVLVGVHKRLLDAGGSIRLTQPRAPVLRVLKLTALDRVFGLHSH